MQVPISELGLQARREPRIMMVFSSTIFFTKYGHFGELLQSLRKRFNLFVASVEKSVDSEMSTQDIGHTYIGLGKLTSYRNICYLLFPLLAFRLLQFCIRNKIDVIIGFNGGYPQLVAHLASFLSRRPLVVYVRVDYKEIRRINLENSISVAIWDFLVTWSLRRATHVISLSRFLREKAIAWGVSVERITVIPFGVDTKTFRPLEIEAKYPDSVVFVGRWSQEKGTALLLEIANRLKHVHFILVGVSSDKITRRAPNLHPMGFVPHKDVARYIALGKLVISTSVTEGQPMSCLEALACGKPVVASRKGGLPEFISSDVGWLFDRDNVEAAIDALDKALKDEVVLHQKGKKAREYALSFSWEAHANRLAEVLAYQFEKF